MAKYNVARIRVGHGEVKRYDISADNFWEAMGQAHRIIRGMRSKTYQPSLVEVTNTNRVGMEEYD